jgi:hypothetical protein
MKKAAGVFGAIWGTFGLLFSLFLFLAIFAPQVVQDTGFAPFGASVFAYYDGAAYSTGAWVIAGSAFALGALGLIGAGIARHKHIAAGLLMLFSSVGMLVVCFSPFLIGEKGLFRGLVTLMKSGAQETVLTFLLTLLILLLGFFGGLFALAARPGKPAAVQSGPIPAAQGPVQETILPPDPISTEPETAASAPPESAEPLLHAQAAPAEAVTAEPTVQRDDGSPE